MSAGSNIIGKGICFAIFLAGLLLLPWSATGATYNHCITCENIETSDGTTTSSVICCSKLSNCLNKCEQLGGQVPEIASDESDPRENVFVSSLNMDPRHLTAVPAASSLLSIEPASAWTPWLNRDSQDGTGDYETLKDFRTRQQACDKPLDIECETVDGMSWQKTGQTYTCDKSKGGICLIKNQKRGDRCKTYRIRFLCPSS